MIQQKRCTLLFFVGSSSFHSSFFFIMLYFSTPNSFVFTLQFSKEFSCHQEFLALESHDKSATFSKECYSPRAHNSSQSVRRNDATALEPCEFSMPKKYSFSKQIRFIALGNEMSKSFIISCAAAASKLITKSRDDILA